MWYPPQMVHMDVGLDDKYFGEKIIELLPKYGIAKEFLQGRATVPKVQFLKNVLQIKETRKAYYSCLISTALFF